MSSAVVFDLDGTLLNTLTDLTNSVNFAMQQLGLESYSESSVRNMIGSGVSVLMKRALTKKHLDRHAQALALQRAYYTQHGGENTVPYAGIEDMLREIEQLGATIIVHTNKDENVAIPLCKQLFGNLVHFVCGTVSDSAVKPNAERLCKLLHSIGATNGVYVGDTEVDIQTARNANLPCISVTWGFRDRQVLVQNGATVCADYPCQVVGLVRELLQK